MREKFNRFDKYMKVKGLNDNQVTIQCGLSQGLLGQARTGKSDLGNKTIEKILNVYQDLNKVWLLTGEGEMLANHITNHNVVHGNATNSIVGDNNTVGYDVPNKYGDSPNIERRWAPVIPSSLVNKPNLDIYMHITKKSLGSVYDRFYCGTADVDMFYYLNDDALEPYYRRGDYLGLKAYDKGCLRIIPGEIYAIDTYNDGMIVRILYNNEDGDFLACCTNKPAYQDFVIPKNEVIRLYKKVLRFSY